MSYQWPRDKNAHEILATQRAVRGALAVDSSRFVARQGIRALRDRVEPAPDATAVGKHLGLARDPKARCGHSGPGEPGRPRLSPQTACSQSAVRRLRIDWKMVGSSGDGRLDPTQSDLAG